MPWKQQGVRLWLLPPTSILPGASTMTKKTAKKRTNVLRKEARKRHQADEIRRSVTTILQHWGLWEQFRRSHSAEEFEKLLTRIGECRDAQPQIVLSLEAAQHREAETIRSGMQTLFSDFARMSVPNLDPRQWWSLYPHTVAHLKTQYDGLRPTVAGAELVDQPRTLLRNKHEELYQHF